MKQSAGILLFKRVKEQVFVFLVHPGGPFWKNKDSGCWSIPKGEFTGEEDPMGAALREFEEETGYLLNGEFMALSPVKLKSNKMVYAWALEQDIDSSKVKSNSFEMEWPPRSGVKKSFPEIDRAEWFSIDDALEKINAAQSRLIRELISKIHMHDKQ